MFPFKNFNSHFIKLIFSIPETKFQVIKHKGKQELQFSRFLFELNADSRITIQMPTTPTYYSV